MESEKITIDVYQLDRYSFYAVYNCEFSFKNNSSKYLNILMGFSINYGIDVWPTGSAKTKNDVTDFKVIIDNKRVEYKWYIHGVNSQLPEIKQYDEVFGFNVVFKAKEKKKILNTYSMLIDPGMLGMPRINYIVLSTLTWKGNIKSAQFIINFHFPVKVHNTQDFNVINKDNLTTLTKTHNKYIPDSDIDISFEAKEKYPVKSSQISENKIKNELLKSIDYRMDQIKIIIEKIENNMQNEQLIPAALKVQSYLNTFEFNDYETIMKYNGYY
jgi:hypothetical protein